MNQIEYLENTEFCIGIPTSDGIPVVYAVIL